MEVAPRLDQQGLREAYVNDRVFNEGDVVIHDATGLQGEIVRKCTNYLICVTEDDMMFKAWTHDVSPYIIEERSVLPDTFRKFMKRLGL